MDNFSFSTTVVGVLYTFFDKLTSVYSHSSSAYHMLFVRVYLLNDNVPLDSCKMWRFMEVKDNWLLHD